MTLPRLRTLGLAVAMTTAGPLAAQSLPGWAEPGGSAPPEVAATPPQPPGSGAPTQVPLDGGLGLLALMGGAYAVRKLRRP